jgi:hypothetical protein
MLSGPTSHPTNTRMFPVCALLAHCRRRSRAAGSQPLLACRVWSSRWLAASDAANQERWVTWRGGGKRATTLHRILRKRTSIGLHLQVLFPLMPLLQERSLIYPLNSSQSSDHNPQLYFGLIFNPGFYNPFGIGPSTLFWHVLNRFFSSVGGFFLYIYCVNSSTHNIHGTIKTNLIQCKGWFLTVFRIQDWKLNQSKVEGCKLNFETILGG